MSDHPATISRSLAAALLLLVLCACAPASMPETAQDGFAPVRAEMPENAICRPDSALLAPQSPPDCKFGRPELKTVDPDQWARLSVDFERRCYQQAERTVRERLRLLQASARCEAAGFRR
jgi:hypothetical protein